MITNDYKEYLNSPQWAKIRNKVLQRDDFKCSICGSYRGLQVHHLNYNHFKNEENYLEDLMTLCNKCHEEIENKKKEQDSNNCYCEQKQEEFNRYQLEKEERERLYQKNFEIFMIDNKNNDISSNGKYDFCNLPFLKKYITENYGEEFYVNLRKTDISNYFGGKRNIIIAKMIKVGKKDYEIAKYGFTIKRIQSVRQMINDFSKYNDICELLKNEYGKKRYGCKVDRKIIERFIDIDIIKDSEYNKKVLLDNFDIFLHWLELSEDSLFEVPKPKLGDD